MPHVIPLTKLPTSLGRNIKRIPPQALRGLGVRVRKAFDFPHAPVRWSLVMASPSRMGGDGFLNLPGWTRIVLVKITVRMIVDRGFRSGAATQTERSG